MAEQLIIYLPCYEPFHAVWAWTDSEGKLKTVISEGSLDDIPKASTGPKPQVLLDSSCIHLASANIPTRNKQRLLQAVPYALEDQLAEEIDTLHFALGKSSRGKAQPIAAINKERLEAVLAALQQAGIAVTMIGADVLALPLAENSLTVLIDFDQVFIRSGPCEGLRCDRSTLPVILKSMLAKAGEELKQIHLYHHMDDAEAKQLFTFEHPELIIHSFRKHPLEVFASNIGDAQAVNLLQGAYAVRRKSNAAWKPWRAAAALLGIWFVLQISANSLELFHLKQQNQQLQAQIEEVFRTAMPQAKRVVDPRVQLERELESLKAGLNGGQNDVMALLGKAAPSLSAGGTVTLDTINFRNDRLELELSTSKLEDLEQIKRRLAGSNQLEVEVISASSSNNQVKGRLSIKSTQAGGKG